MIELSQIEKILLENDIPPNLIETMAMLSHNRMELIFGSSSLRKNIDNVYQRGLILNGSLAPYLGDPIKDFLLNKGVQYEIGVIVGNIKKLSDTVLVEDTFINFKVINGLRYFN